MKTTNRINGIRMTLTAGLLLAAAGAAASQTADTGRPDFAEMAGPSIRMQAAQAMASIRNELRLTAEDASPIELERAPATVLAADTTADNVDEADPGEGARVTGGLVIYIGNR